MKTPTLLFVCFLSIIMSCGHLINSQTDMQNRFEKEPKKATVEATPKIETQTPSQPPSLTLPEGYELVQTEEGAEIVYGDLDGDTKTDAAALIVKSTENESYDFGDEVHVAIFPANSNHVYVSALQSQNLGGESIRYKSEKKLSLKKNVISYWHQSMRHHIEIKIRFQGKPYNDYMIIGKEYHNYGGMTDGAVRKSINYLSGIFLLDMNEIDMEKEEQVALPTQKGKVSTKLLPLTMLDEESVYLDI